MPRATANLENETSSVRRVLAAILSSPQFSNSPQLCSFLSYVVEKTLAGESSGIKAYSIATEALGRGPSFDPISDSTVRVLAGRVRSALQLYNLKSCLGQGPIIELLPGSYVPVFRWPTKQQPAVSTSSAAGGSATGVVVRPPQYAARGEGSPTKRRGSRRLLIVDDDPDIRRILHRIGADHGYQVVDAASANEFWVAYRALKPTHLILDIMLPGADGLEIMRELSRQSSRSKILLVSGVDRRLLRTSERLGREFGLNIRASISKPFDIETVEHALAEPDSEDKEVSVADLVEAIQQQQISLYFQPKLSLCDDGRIILEALEGLARWIHPTKGHIPPDVFIPLAEDNGLIEDLTWRMADHAAACFSNVADLPENCGLAINVSPALFDNPLLAEHLAARLDGAGIARHLISIELTETATADQSTGSLDAITRLRLKGFTISIDDFGTGFSSLLRLLRMPFNEIKIDKSFVMEMTANKEAQILVETMINLAKSLGLRVCAEGVETRECLEHLRQLGCDSVQGFLFSRAVPLDELPGTLRLLQSEQWQEQFRLAPRKAS